MHNRFGLVPAAAVGALLLTNAALAQIPEKMSYQGMITIPGNPTSANFKFRIFDVATGGTFLYEEAHTGVGLTAAGGGLQLFNVLIGSTTPLTLPFDKPYWLEIEVNGTTVSRTELTSSPYAFRSRFVDQLADGQVTTEKLANGAVTLQKLSGAGGASGQVLTLDAGGNVTWANSAAGGGTITGVTAGPGLSGGGATGNVVLEVANQGIKIGRAHV